MDLVTVTTFSVGGLLQLALRKGPITSSFSPNQRIVVQLGTALAGVVLSSTAGFLGSACVISSVVGIMVDSALEFARATNLRIQSLQDAAVVGGVLTSAAAAYWLWFQHRRSPHVIPTVPLPSSSSSPSTPAKPTPSPPRKMPSPPRPRPKRPHSRLVPSVDPQLPSFPPVLDELIDVPQAVSVGSFSTAASTPPSTPSTPSTTIAAAQSP